MENTENAVASEIEVHSNSNLLQFVSIMPIWQRI